MPNERVAALENGLEIWKLEIAGLKEQDINAQTMDKRSMRILTANIKNAGALESLPYVYKNGETFEIVSGHHRARAANAAGMKDIYCLVETKALTRSQIVSKQIAHNQLVGEADQEILGQLAKQMKEVDDLIASGLPEEYLNGITGESVVIDIPHLDFDWRTVQLTFLPKQMKEFETLCKTIDSKAEFVGVADREQFEAFSQAMIQYGRTKNVQSIGTTISLLTEIALREIEAANGATE